MNALNTILIILASVQLFDIVIALILYLVYDKKLEYLLLCIMWIGMAAFFFMDWYLGEASLIHIYCSYVIAGVSGIAIGQLISVCYHIPYKAKNYIALLVFSYVVSFGFYFSGFHNFAFLGSLVGVGISAPVLISAVKAFKQSSQKFTLDYIFLITLSLWGIHLLDYPFLRPDVDKTLSIFGFSFALFLTYVTSVFIPVILNRHIYNELTQKLNKKLSLKSDELIQAKEQIIARENLANLGELSAGIAHEIKNPINIILNSALALKQVVQEPLNSERVENLAEMIERNSNRADRIVKSILAQSSQTSPYLKTVQINDLITSTYDLVSSTYKDLFVELKLDLAKLPLISVYENELTRCFVNLIDNAFKAMEAKKYSDNEKPCLEIKTYMDKRYVYIDMQDNGVGIPVDVQDKVFKPFFTTRCNGEGTGLGMSLVKDTIKYHKGNINFTSEVGKFTKFEVSIWLDLKEGDL